MKKIAIIITALALFSCKGTGKSNHALVITFTKGEVTIKRSGESIKATVGSLLQATDTLSVAKKSRADFQVAKETVVRVGAGSEIEIKKLFAKAGDKNTELQLNQGSLYAKVQKLSKQSTFAVTTPTIVAGVRGTEFHASAGSGADSVAVTSGKVAVENPEGKSTLLKEGSEARGDDKELKETKIDDTKLEKLKKMSKIAKFDNKTWDKIETEIASSKSLGEAKDLKQLFAQNKSKNSVDGLMKGLKTPKEKPKGKSAAEIARQKKIQEQLRRAREKLKKIQQPF